MTSDERTVDLVHRTTSGARPVLWNPAEKLGISDGRSSKDDTTIIACYDHSVVLSAAHAVPVELLSMQEDSVGGSGRGAA
jgi:hypothetical protein